MTGGAPSPAIPKEGERLAFDESHGDYRALAFYRDGQYARILILRRDEVMLERDDYPSYRIWNVAAHLPDIAADMEEQRAGQP